MVNNWVVVSPWAARLAEGQAQEIPWWVWILLIVFLVFLLWGIWMRGRGKGTVKPEKEVPVPQVEAHAEAHMAAAPSAMPELVKAAEPIDVSAREAAPAPEEAHAEAHMADAPAAAPEVVKAAEPIDVPAHETPPAPEQAPIAAPEPAAARASPLQPDDLEIIEGIGPKIAGILKNAGIPTFALLAKTKPETISQILKEGGLRIPADPTTWPEQARLAAEGKLEELQKLQDSLKGGRVAS